MALQRTLSILKPDITGRNLTGEVNARIEQAGFRIIAQKRLHLTMAQAGAFYAVHKERPFYKGLCEIMSAAPVVVQVLEAEDAIAKYRALMGATDPTKAEAGTLRAVYGESLDANSCHGSDGPETAAWEIGYFFAGLEIVG